MLTPRSPSQRHVNVILCGLILTGTALTVAAVAEGEDPTPPATVDSASPDAPSDITLRPETPPQPPDPREVDNRLDDEGNVRFNFQGQPWLDVLQWLAKISQLNLDWQELPAGYLNIRTQHSYSKTEARDLINRHLLDRGFTLVKHGEILSVINVKKLDPSLIPRLTPAELDQAQPHDFVRVSFALEWLVAESAVEEFKPLISPNGKLAALKSTNRLEAIDAVANLREIRRLLTEEESPRSRKRLVREFRLEHVRAADVQPQLHKLLGLDKLGAAATPPTGDPAAIVQQMAQILQRGASAPGAPPQKQAAPQPQVQLIVDTRANTILAHAPPDQMAVIAEAIRAIDKPSDKSRSLIRNAHRVQVYPLAVVEPEALIKMANELADLDPGTRLQVDKKHRAVVVQGPLADHLTIRLLVDKVDGTSRKFRTIALHTLEAEFVAGSLDLVMGGGDGSKRQPARDGEDESRRFRTVADVENNRLLLWVNETELEEVYQLLAELGERVDRSGAGPSVLRIPDSFDRSKTADLVRRLQEAWPKIAPNPLEFGPGTDALEEAPPSTDGSPKGLRPLTQARPSASLNAVVRWLNASASNRTVRQVKNVRPESDDGDETTESLAAACAATAAGREATEAALAPPEGTSVSPPVRIDRDVSGRLLITSEDDAALQMLRKLVGEIVPPPTDFKVFRMKHKDSSVYAIAENFKQYFDEKQKWDRPTPRFYDPSSGKSVSAPREGDGRKPSKQRQPKFIVDSDSNSILALGADAEQLKVIGELLELYDTGGSKEPKPARISRLVEIKHATARQIADAVKDVYRDLLGLESPQPRNNNNDPQARRPVEPTYTYAYSSSSGRGEATETLVKFKGQLSIGVDETSNTLVVSAPESLLEDVVATIESLDEMALRTGPRVRVMKISRDVNPGEFHKRLQRLVAKPQAGQSAGSPSQPR